MNSTPHVSPALSRLRGWVTLAAILVAVCAVAKLVVFGFVHYTEARYVEQDPGVSKPSLAVVKGPAAKDAVQSAPIRRVENGRVLSIQPAGVEHGARVDEGRELSAADANMKRASTLAVCLGLVSAIMLAFLTMLGTLVAAGGAVPGIERTVNSCIWSVILLLLCLPWSGLTEAVPISGAFCGYEATTEASVLVLSGQAGGGQLHLECVGIPALVVACAIGVAFTFRTGVEQGIIVTSISEFDRAIDNEISSLQETGIGARQPKVLGALYRTLGDPGQPQAGLSGDQLGSPLARLPRESSRDDALRDLRQADPGRPLPRPI